MVVSYKEQMKNHTLPYEVKTKEELESDWLDNPETVKVITELQELDAHTNQIKCEGDIKKMGYNAKNASEGKGSNLPKDEILVGVIANIEDGIVKQFIPETAVEGWKGDVNSPAINLQLDVTVVKGDDKTVEKLTQMFTYILEGDKTIYSSRSNLGKYKKKYEKLPEVGDQVKVITDEDGYGKIKIE